MYSDLSELYRRTGENKLKRVSKADSVCTFSNDFAKSMKHLLALKQAGKLELVQPGETTFVRMDRLPKI